jgi:hypothetical protein
MNKSHARVHDHRFEEPAASVDYLLDGSVDS